MDYYKQKYEEAIARMNKWVEGSEITDPKEVAEFVFPEFKEGDDERIRKELIRAFTVTADKRDYEIYGNGITYRQVLSWLEKQGRQKPSDNVELKWKKGNDGEFLYETSVVWVHNETKTLATAGLRLDSNTFYIPISELEKYPKEEFERQNEQKPTWSEDDEKLLTLCASAIQNRYNDGLFTTNEYKQTSLWLKSLKNRVQPQPKQEWSEEDTAMMILIAKTLDDHKKDVDFVSYNTTYENCINWLVYLKNRYTWKPSEEQMNTLEHYMHTLVCNEHKKILFGLYADLKKLKEE